MAAKPQRVGIVHCVGSARREHQPLVLARLLHVLAQAGAPDPRAHRRRSVTTSTSICAPPAKAMRNSTTGCRRKACTLSAAEWPTCNRLADAPHGRGQLIIRAEDTLAGIRAPHPGGHGGAVGGAGAAGGRPRRAPSVQHQLLGAKAGSWSGTPSWRRSAPSPTASSSPGACQGPKDIPDTCGAGRSGRCRGDGPGIDGGMSNWSPTPRT